VVLTGLEAIMNKDKPFCGYEWTAGARKQVAYLGQDFHIHELSVGLDGAPWVHTDISGSLGLISAQLGFVDSPKGIDRHLTAFEWKGEKAKQIIWRGAQTYHFYELSQRTSTGWRYHDLTALTGAPNSDFFPWQAFVWEQAHAKQIGYCGGPGLFYEIYNKSGQPWKHRSIAPPAEDLEGFNDYPVFFPGNTLTGFESMQDQSAQYIFDMIGQAPAAPSAANPWAFYEVASYGGVWRFADLTERNIFGSWSALITVCPPGGYIADTKGYDWPPGGAKHVAILAADESGAFTVHELSLSTAPIQVWPSHDWQHANLSAITGAPAPNGDGLDAFSWNARQTKQVVYTGVDHHVYELWVSPGGSWAHADLTKLAGAPPVALPWLSAYQWEAGQSKQVVYATEDGHLHELYVHAHGDTWQWADLTALTNSPPVVHTD
jgi:hypothetical protein